MKMLMKHLIMHFHNTISLGQIIKLPTYRSITMLNLFPACMIAFSAWEKVSDVKIFTYQSRSRLHHYRFITNKQNLEVSLFNLMSAYFEDSDSMLGISPHHVSC